MAPAVVAVRQPRAPGPAAHDGATPATYAQATSALMEFAKQVREHLETHGEFVGDRFAEEARKRHDAAAATGQTQVPTAPREPEAAATRPRDDGNAPTGQPAADRPLWGTATLQEARDLLEDGIAILPLPPGPKDRN